MSINKKIFLFVILVLFIVSGYGAYSIYRFFDYSVESPYILALLQPSGNGYAYLIEHGVLMDRTLTLMVSHTGFVIDAKWIGSLDSDDTLFFIEASWARDGSFFASRSDVRGYNKLPEDVIQSIYYTHAYDFTESKKYVPAKDAFDKTPQDWLDRNQLIESMLQNRGGSLLAVTRDQYQTQKSKMTWSQWHNWRQTMKKAKAFEKSQEYN